MLKRMEGLFRGDHLLIVRSILGREISRPNLLIRFSEGPISGQPSDHLIDIHIAAFEVLHPCIAGQIVHERREAFFALAQCLLRSLALGDVGCENGEAFGRGIITVLPPGIGRGVMEFEGDVDSFFHGPTILAVQFGADDVRKDLPYSASKDLFAWAAKRSHGGFVRVKETAIPVEETMEVGHAA